MKVQNNLTGDTIEIPTPDMLGHSVVLFNGRIVERVTYSDLPNVPPIITEDGRIYTSDEWTAYLIEQLRTGAWKIVN